MVIDANTFKFLISPEIVFLFLILLSMNLVKLLNEIQNLGSFVQITVVASRRKF